MELYGTFHAMGVIVTLAPSDDPDEDAVASVNYRISGKTYRQGFPLTRVSPTRFVGSLFGLTPGTSYDVRLTFYDPDGGPLDGAMVTGSAGTRTSLAIPTARDNFYASPTGSGSACTLAAPCALSQALGLAQPGDAVVLRGGVYYQGLFSLPRSGLPGAPIMIKSYPNETAVMDGADPATFSWTHWGGGVYQTPINGGGPHLVMAGGERLYPYQNLAGLQSLSWGIPGFYTSGATLYVRLAGNADPTGVTMEVSRYNHAFYIERDYIYFSDLTFRHYGQGSYAKAIYFNNASDNLVQNCTFAVNDLGIGIKRASHRNVIQDNIFFDTTFLWPWDAVKGGSQLETGGVNIYSPTTGRGTIIRRNTFHNYFDGFTCCPEDNGSTTNETDVYDNLVYNAGDDGLSADGTCSNVRIWNNTFRDVLVGISLAPIYEGPLYAIRNLIYRTGAGNSSYSGYPFKFNSGYGQSGRMYLLHNTADAVLPGNNGFYVKAPGSWELIYSRNNIWAGTAYAVENYNAAWPIDLDYDNLWNAGNGDLVRWDGVRYPDLATFNGATGQLAHGMSVWPGFAGAPGGDYTLAENSALIDAGVNIPGINDNHTGGAPDIGAYETGQALVYVEASGTCGGKIPCYATIQAALDAAVPHAATLIEVAAGTYPPNLINQAHYVTLRCGWDAAFNLPPPGLATVVQGTLMLKAGTLQISDLTLN
jgi:parallel beta-helix repeat protein